jgi:EmrB/QacA subfamily drug resistance transporter
MTSRLSNPKVAVSVVYVATFFMFILDSTVVTVALPTLRSDFHTSTEAVSSVVTAYLVTLAVAMPAAAWLGDRCGSKRVLLAALAMFTAASALCGQASSLPELIAFRALQGVAGGLSIPVGTAMLYRIFPTAERIRATRLLTAPTLVAPALGPVLGGLLVDELSWRWIFYVNLPVGLAAMAFGLRYLPSSAGEVAPGRFDLPGFVLIGAGFPLAMYALANGPSDGWGTPPIFLSAAASVVLLTAFVLLELRTRTPLLQLRLLANRAYRVASGVVVVGGAGFLGVLFLAPLFLQNGLGYSALHSGLSTFTEAVGGIIGIQISTRLFRRVGPRPLMAGGLGSSGVFVAVAALVGPSTAVWAMPVLIFFIGTSFGFAMAPSQVTALATISMAETAQAATLFSVNRQAGSAIGVALIATCLGLVHSYHWCFALAAVILLAGSFTGARIRKSDALPAMAAPEPAAAQPSVALDLALARVLQVAFDRFDLGGQRTGYPRPQVGLEHQADPRRPGRDGGHGLLHHGHGLVPVALDRGEHGVGPVRQPALAYHPHRLGHGLADRLTHPERRHRKRDKHLSHTPSVVSAWAASRSRHEHLYFMKMPGQIGP